MAPVAKLPIFMRVGDSEEFKVGTLALDGELSEPDENGHVHLNLHTPSGDEFLKALGDAAAKAVSGH